MSRPSARIETCGPHKVPGWTKPARNFRWVGYWREVGKDRPWEPWYVVYGRTRQELRATLAAIRQKAAP
jgi:hypothetical protein